MARSAFELDKQTLADLAIFPGSTGEISMLTFFDRTATFGGRDKLKELFETPLTRSADIERRIAAIKYLQDTGADFNAGKGACDYIEFYLSRYDKPTAVSKIKAIERKVKFFFTGNNEYYIISRGVNYTINLLKTLYGLAEDQGSSQLPELLKIFNTTILETLHHPDFIFVQALFGRKKLSAIDIARCDHLFRYLGFHRLKVLLDIVYQLDVFTAAGSFAKTDAFTFPVLNRSGGQVLRFNGLFHPFIKNAVGNNIRFDNDQNICFVTGANMAGKSTLLKSIGISVFLSQVGFPVPAAYMETSVFDGLITTINLADDLQKGDSHFYTEVLRVKHVAAKMLGSQNMVIIFDELFRGTNVKDAFDASLDIVTAFSKLRKGIFIISTHIVEVAREMAEISNISFKFMETIFENDQPQYSYKLMDGITDVRMGMWIVKNEGITEIIDRIIKSEL